MGGRRLGSLCFEGSAGSRVTCDDAPVLLVYGDGPAGVQGVESTGRIPRSASMFTLSAVDVGGIAGNRERESELNQFLDTVR